jgi:Cof subfamily protein (haloacid dehalogenase superfamily)
MNSGTKIELVVSDLDGTLLNRQQRISKETRDVIHRFLERDIEFAVATGRHIVDALEIVSDLDCKIPLITANGAMLHDRHGALIRSDPINPEWVSEIIDMSATYSVHRNIYYSDKWLVDAPNDFLLSLHKDSSFTYEVVNLGALDYSDILKLYFVGERTELEDLRALLDSRFGRKINATFSLENTLEIMQGGVSKGSALACLLSSLDIPASRTLAFGDGLNDLEMLSYSGHRVVMGNAQAELKRRLTDYSTTHSNCDNGVARYLNANL